MDGAALAMRLWFYKISAALCVAFIATSVQAADVDNDTLDDDWELTEQHINLSV